MTKQTKTNDLTLPKMNCEVEITFTRTISGTISVSDIDSVDDLRFVLTDTYDGSSGRFHKDCIRIQFIDEDYGVIDESESNQVKEILYKLVSTNNKYLTNTNNIIDKCIDTICSESSNSESDYETYQPTPNQLIEISTIDDYWIFDLMTHNLYADLTQPNPYGFQYHSTIKSSNPSKVINRVEYDDDMYEPLTPTQLSHFEQQVKQGWW